MFKLVVLSCLFAAGSAQYFGAYPGYGYPFAYSAASFYPYDGNYRGPLSLAPGQPANILGADGRPLDTLEVNLDKSAHYTRKAFESAGIHLIKKRSAPFAPIATTYGAIATPFAYNAFAYPYAFPYSFDGNYRGPLSLAPGQPANILGADGRPLDTLEVNLDKAAHYTKKAYENAGIHLIKKRSAPVVAPLPAAPVAALAPLPAAPVVHATPIVYSTPFATSYAYAPLNFGSRIVY
ncbi:unnamed protein product [Plutella xylostella]|uniref:(diamondback moth) hypothetical protein n=1 Tax=Plutella xylostella TaxID=51655 RepID=A0A8S4CWS0_PLUXY|nr:uncharacterized protein LOC105388396 [Plutella xylostella]CAG9087121.1 unnamed protein product [Plutella xylostella]